MKTSVIVMSRSPHKDRLKIVPCEKGFVGAGYNFIFYCPVELFCASIVDAIPMCYCTHTPT